jgi:multidrug efflux pump subunit AcrB
MEAAPQFYRDPTTLNSTYVHASGPKSVPLQAFTKAHAATSPLAVNHSSFFPSVTISFNLSPGTSLGQATTAINQMQQRIGTPPSVRGQFAGTAQAFLASLSTEPMLIVAALLSIYIVLGVLYESFIHPITILTTLPSAGVGAIFALLVFHSEFDVISVIGIFLLIGIVKKNAILMIDFALLAEREQGMSTEDSIFEAAMLRFRPILMTTSQPSSVLAACPWHGHRLGVAPPAWYRHLRRTSLQPDPDPLYNAGHLPLLRSLQPMDQAPARYPESRYAKPPGSKPSRQLGKTA